MLDVKDISVSYGERAVLNGVSLALSEGETIALLGANGAGKTTLIKALNGTVPVSEGTITVDGRALSEMSRREIARKIAVVAQENETRFPVTVLEFVLSGRFAYGGTFGWESDADIAFAHNALAECELTAFADRSMNELSGGERQRVVLARALATNARILLLDEPTANLDLANQAMMFRLVKKRCQEQAAAAVVITHDLNMAAAFADEIIMLAGGRTAARGKPADVLTAENIKSVFGVGVMLDQHPMTGKLRVTNIF